MGDGWEEMYTLRYSKANFGGTWSLKAATNKKDYKDSLRSVALNNAQLMLQQHSTSLAQPSVSAGLFGGQGGGAQAQWRNFAIRF